MALGMSSLAAVAASTPRAPGALYPGSTASRQADQAQAAEAIAARMAGSKLVAAEGEKRSASHLKEAGLVLEESKSALQLRYLQTLGSVATEQSSTIVFPFPIDSLSLTDLGGSMDKDKID